jgi:spore coat protein U-like protein
MRLAALVPCCAILGVASPAAAQISVTGMRDLAFGAVIVGIPSTVAPSDPLRSGRLRITAPAGSRLKLDFSVPNRLDGPGGSRLPIKFNNSDAIALGNAPGSVPVVLDPNPKAITRYQMGASTAVDIFLGGTVTPAGTQAPGNYVGTITLTVTIL